MVMKKLVIVVLVGLLTATLSHAAVVVFSEDFSGGNGARTIDGTSPQIGEDWSVTAGAMKRSWELWILPSVTAACCSSLMHTLLIAVP